jgi:hypothetical protein
MFPINERRRVRARQISVDSSGTHAKIVIKLIMVSMQLYFVRPFYVHFGYPVSSEELTSYV